MVRGVRDKHGAEDLRPRRTEHELVAQSQLPGSVGLIPRHLLKHRTQLRAQLFENPDALGTSGERRLGWSRGEAVEFIASRHQESETGQPCKMCGELAECARLRVRTPVVVAVRDSLKHASGCGELRFQIGE